MYKDFRTHREAKEFADRCNGFVETFYTENDDRYYTVFYGPSRFEVGQCYTFPGLHGPSFEIKIVARDDQLHTLKFIETRFPNAGASELSITYDDWGNECALVWTYKGFEGYVRSNSDW